jgi:hypothetical protein
MSFHPNLQVEALLCICKPRSNDPRHWIFMLRSENAEFGTWYHSTGGPTQGVPYKVQIQGSKRVNSHGIATTQSLGFMSPSDVNKVKSAAQRTPPQRCQTYVVELVADLEGRHLLPHGTAARLEQQVEPARQKSSSPSRPSTPDRRERTPTPPGWKTPSPPRSRSLTPLRH